MPSTTPKPFVFVLMPFDEDFDDVYQLGIKAACEEAGAYCERLDEQIFQEGMLQRIYNQINKADAIIADMTGTNANVFYEVGYAHALGKTVLLLTEDAEDIPFDLKHRQHEVYGGSISTLKERLIEKVGWALSEPEEVSNEQSMQLDFMDLDYRVGILKPDQFKNHFERLEHSYHYMNEFFRAAPEELARVTVNIEAYTESIDDEEKEFGFGPRYADVEYLCGFRANITPKDKDGEVIHRAFYAIPNSDDVNTLYSSGLGVSANERVKIAIEPTVGSNMKDLLQELMAHDTTHLLTRTYAGANFEKEQFEKYFSSQGIQVVYEKNMKELDTASKVKEWLSKKLVGTVQRLVGDSVAVDLAVDKQ